MLFFFLVLMRMSAFVVTWPIFGVETVSSHIKILFALILTLVVFPTLKISPEQAVVLKADLILPVAREVFIGFSMGYLARFFFFAFRIAGEMVSSAMGLSSAQVFMPSLGGQSTSVEQLFVALASLFYLGVNGHHYLIQGLVNSFSWAPAAQLTLNTSQFTGVGQMAQEVIELGLKFSAPVVISILGVNLILGVIGKTVPQLNVLVTSFPINILIGFVLLIITMPMMMDQMGEFMETSTAQVFKFVKSY